MWLWCVPYSKRCYANSANYANDNYIKLKLHETKLCTLAAAFQLMTDFGFGSLCRTSCPSLRSALSCIPLIKNSISTWNFESIKQGRKSPNILRLVRLQKTEQHNIHTMNIRCVTYVKQIQWINIPILFFVISSQLKWN